MIRTLRKLIRETLEGRVVTFDFDDTLLWTRVIRDEDGDYVEHFPIGPNEDVLPIMRKTLENPSIDVYVVTSRHDTARSRAEVEGYLGEWGILDFPNFKGVVFTNGHLKVGALKRLGSIRHYDDDAEELIVLPPEIEGVQAYPHKSWMRNKTV